MLRYICGLHVLRYSVDSRVRQRNTPSLKPMSLISLRCQGLSGPVKYHRPLIFTVPLSMTLSDLAPKTGVTSALFASYRLSPSVVRFCQRQLSFLLQTKLQVPVMLRIVQSWLQQAAQPAEYVCIWRIDVSGDRCHGDGKTGQGQSISATAYRRRLD